MRGGGDFWTKRKAKVEAEALEQERQVEKAREEELAERSDEEILAEFNLVEPETLEDPDQVKEFLNSAIPQRLKTRALRRLWTLNPIFGQMDGLVDYGEDYTDAALVVENMQTVYQVGKGMLTAFADEDDEDEGLLEDAPEEELEPEDDFEMAEIETTPIPDPEPEPAAAPQRRMRFSFDASQGASHS